MHRRHESITLRSFVFALICRFEPDMLAFSGCNYGLAPEQEAELVALRARWKNLPRDTDPDHQRRHGHCVLTPEEVSSLQMVCLWAV
jgi:hypothetical protein